MEWRDQGVLLSVRRHGETSAIIDVFTSEHGRHAGVVRGGTSRKLAPILQPGAQLSVEWRARLEEHLGTFRVEPIISRAASVMTDRAGLAAFNAVCGLLVFSLPEREPHPRLYSMTQVLLDAVCAQEDWRALYVQWELALLEDMGFGLDLASCAATGSTEDLAYVSPASGRAVSAKGAGEWVDRLLPLPPVLLGETAITRDLLDGLKTTGYFLENWLAPALGDRQLPEARERLISIMARNGRGDT